jgi:hypothetical protein
VQALADKLLARYGNAVQAILYYGSCFRKGDDREGIVDLYVLVDRYEAIYSLRVQSFLNKLLPPNVFYLQVGLQDRVVRAKYAVLSHLDFLRGTSKRWFHSYLWGRFCQPVGLIYARNSQVARQVQLALAQAILTFTARVLPMVTSPFTARDLWGQGLLLTYRAELRAEQPDDLIHLFDAEPEHYQQLTRAALTEVPFPVEIDTSRQPVRYHSQVSPDLQRKCRLAWKVRFLQGKVLSVLRLLKGFFTFQGGPDYILWKIERHSGVAVELTPRQKQYPLLTACLLFWRLYRRGAFR